MKARNSNKATSKSTEMDYISFKNSEAEKVDDFDIKKSLLWLKKGQYDACGVSIKLDEARTLSDWTRCIELENVHLAVRENDKGYPVLIISGQSEDIPF